MAKEIISPETRDSMGNPAGYSHKRIYVPDGGGKPFPNFTTVDKNRLKYNISEDRKKQKSK